MLIMFYEWGGGVHITVMDEMLQYHHLGFEINLTYFAILFVKKSISMYLSLFLCLSLVFICARECACQYVCVYVCVRETERGRRREREEGD